MTGRAAGPVPTVEQAGPPRTHLCECHRLCDVLFCSDHNDKCPEGPR